MPTRATAWAIPFFFLAFTYADESDRVGYPLGADTGSRVGDSGGDMHAVVVERGTCRLYETWNTRESGGRWTAGSGAVWSLKSNRLRPDTWTSADAAGLPILPGLLRWSEVKVGPVNHAIRFTTDVTSRHHIWPARHDAGSQDSLAYPPMGARFRLKSTFSTTGYGVYARRVITAMKHYGLVLADNGSPWFFQGAQTLGLAARPDRGAQAHPGLRVRRRQHGVPEGEQRLRCHPLGRFGHRPALR